MALDSNISLFVLTGFAETQYLAHTLTLLCVGVGAVLKAVHEIAYSAGYKLACFVVIWPLKVWVTWVKTVTFLAALFFLGPLLRSQDFSGLPTGASKL